MKSITLFQVLPKEIAFFQHIDTKLQCVDAKSIVINEGSEAINNALKYRYPLKYLGKQAQQLIVLCIPARQLQVSSKQHYQPQLPFLIKTSKQTNLKGYLSGRRSAIFLSQDKLIRYKGCGNDGEGFIYQDKQLRGSHFYHTAKRQIYMTEFINKVLLEQIHQQSANLPLFFYQFPKTITNYGLKNDIKLLNKYCCVFETKGDRRVGTHLISPLQILFVKIFDASVLNLQNYFKQKKRLDEYGLVELLVNYQLFIDKGQIFLQKIDKSTPFQNYVSLRDIQELGSPKIVANFDEIIKKISTKFIKKQPVNLNELLISNTNWIKIIGIILQKMGWEMGQIKRIFCQKNINWGFFNDHGHWHCNAHLNNFIIRKPQINSRFTMPLDFDLSFTKNQFINIDLTSQNYGERDDDGFQQMLLAQFNAMESSLSGIEIMNFKYSIDPVQQEEGPTLIERMLRVVFRDTLIKSFREGMKRNKQEYDRINKQWNENIHSITRLIQSCLHMSGQSQT